MLSPFLVLYNYTAEERHSTLTRRKYQWLILMQTAASCLSLHPQQLRTLRATLKITSNNFLPTVESHEWVLLDWCRQLCTPPSPRLAHAPAGAPRARQEHLLKSTKQCCRLPLFSCLPCYLPQSLLAKDSRKYSREVVQPKSQVPSVLSAVTWTFPCSGTRRERHLKKHKNTSGSRVIPECTSFQGQWWQNSS